jgi:hypothetical protein
LIAALPSKALPIGTNPKPRDWPGFAIHDHYDFRNSAERLKEFPQCAFFHVKGKISDVKLHDDW